MMHMPQVRPSSISAFMPSKNRIGFIQSDNYGGVSLEMFSCTEEKDPKRLRYQPIDLEPEGLKYSS